MPNTDICAKCKSDGVPIKAFAQKSIEWRCTMCGFSWDINEDFICNECGKEVPGRYLFCSPECQKQAEEKGHF